MIDIRDLTIGNWVFDGNHTKFPMQITSLSEGYVTMSFPSNEGMDWESRPEDLEGIPLTGELLKKIGFSFKDGLWRYWFGVHVKPEAGFVFIENKDKEHWMYGTCTCKDVWYLHQLQNLVRIITKKELLDGNTKTL